MNRMCRECDAAGGESTESHECGYSPNEPETYCAACGLSTDLSYVLCDPTAPAPPSPAARAVAERRGDYLFDGDKVFHLGCASAAALDAYLAEVGSR